MEISKILGLLGKSQIARVAQIVKKVMIYPISLIVSPSYAPKDLLSDDCSQLVDISRLKLDKTSYVVAKIHNGRIWTNRTSNISVISKKSLIPLVSWQYLNGSVLPDKDNYLLNKKLLICRPPKRVNGTVISLLTGGGGNYNYYHWLFDCLPRLRIAESIVRLDERTKYMLPEDTHAFQRETLELLGIPAASCISSKKCNHLQAASLIATSHPNPNPSAIPEWIVHFLRKSFLERSSAKHHKTFVYISRGDSVNSRRLINEEILSQALESAGFGIYRLSELSFLDQVSLFSQAKMIVGVHGAGFANLAFASRGAVVFELFSDQYQPNMYERISSLVGLDYHKIVGEEVESGKCAQQTDFRLLGTSVTTILKHAEQIAAGGT